MRSTVRYFKFKLIFEKREKRGWRTHGTDPGSSPEKQSDGFILNGSLQDTNGGGHESYMLLT